VPPVSAITHYAPVDRIEPYGESGKYKVVFSEPAKEIAPIPFGDAPSGAMQGPRYTSFERLKSAKSVSELVRPTALILRISCGRARACPAHAGP
jgi:hypothetical protein